MNVSVFGLPGSGKTTVGRCLARQLNFGFIDLDEKISISEGRSIVDIIGKKGENYFRAVERGVLRKVLSCRNHVISLGGGGVSEFSTMQQLKQAGMTVWMDVPTRVIARRLLLSPLELKRRPLLNSYVEQHFKTYDGEVVFELDHKQSIIEQYLTQRFEKTEEVCKSADVVFRDYNSEPMFAARQIALALLREK